MRRTILLGFAAWLALATSPAFATIAFVQKAKTADGNSTMIASISITVTAIGSGNDIAGECMYSTGTATDHAPTSITDNASGNPNSAKYTLTTHAYDTVNTNGLIGFYGINITGGPTSITVNWPSAQVLFVTCALNEFSGVGSFDTAVTVTAANDAGNGANTASSPSLTPAGSGELLYGFFECTVGGCTETCTAGTTLAWTGENNTFAAPGSAYANDQICDEFLVYNSVAAASATFGSNAGFQDAIGLLAIKASTGAQPPGTKCWPAGLMGVGC